jgi:hypothetical protein
MVVPVHLRATLGYRSTSTLAEIQREVEAYDYKRAFDTIAILPNEVALDSPTGSLRISTKSAFFSAAGEFTDSPTIAAAFDILERAKVGPVVHIRPTVYFAAEVKGCDLAALLQTHIEMLSFPGFDIGALGRIADTAVVFSLDGPEEIGTFNVQYGPMGRNQWGVFGGPEAEAIEDSLPAVAWGVGFFYPGASPRFRLTITEARERLLGMVNDWRNMASKFIVL